jgi:hypothetical protein
MLSSQTSGVKRPHTPVFGNIPMAVERPALGSIQKASTFPAPRGLLVSTADDAFAPR